MRHRKCDPPPALMFNGKEYATAAELQEARDALAERRARWLALIEWDRLQDEIREQLR
jgi:hypothetical protein